MLTRMRSVETGVKETLRFTRLLALTLPTVTQEEPFHACTSKSVTPKLVKVIESVGCTGAPGLSCSENTVTWSIVCAPPAKSTSTQSGQMLVVASFQPPPAPQLTPASSPLMSEDAGKSAPPVLEAL